MPNKVRCKVVVTSKADSFNPWDKSTATTVTMSPVQGDENKTWAKYTPSGEFRLNINNPAAVDAFTLGHVYFVDFDPAPATEAEESK